jgi:hypothetical protein
MYCTIGGSTLNCSTAIETTLTYNTNKARMSPCSTPKYNTSKAITLSCSLQTNVFAAVLLVPLLRGSKPGPLP